jgi:hypothetical protein
VGGGTGREQRRPQSRGEVFTQPWKIAYQIERLRQRDYEFIEEACWEGVSVRNRLDAGRLAAKEGKVRIHSHSER